MSILCLLLLLMPATSPAAGIPRVQPENWQGNAIQPCVIWYTNGTCGRYATGVDLADRSQVNLAIDWLEWRIEQLEARLRK